MMASAEAREDGAVVIVADKGDPILKLEEDSTILYGFGRHLLYTRAAKRSFDALKALRDWCDEGIEAIDHA